MTTAFKTQNNLKTFKILILPGQRLDRLYAKIKFLKIRMSRDSVPKNSAFIANRVFKKLRVKTQDDYVITPSEVVCSAGFICQV